MRSITPTRSHFRRTTLAWWHKWMLFALSLFWLAWIAILLYNSAKARPAIIAQHLIAPTEILTHAFVTFAAPTPSVIWSDSHAQVLFDEPITRSQNSIVSFGYRAQHQPNSPIEINQLVSDTVWPIFAAWQLIRAQPGSIDQAGDEAFSTLTLPYRSTIADQQRAVCILDGADSCRVAYVWAQYGQYVVRLRVAGENRPVSVTLISGLFEQIDRHITQMLQEASS